MSALFLVESPDGTLVHKLGDDLKPEDMLVFDGPDSTAGIDAARAQLDAEIQAAGGFEAWQRTLEA